jgi:hypothetical protein
MKWTRDKPARVPSGHTLHSFPFVYMATAVSIAAVFVFTGVVTAVAHCRKGLATRARKAPAAGGQGAASFWTLIRSAVDGCEIDVASRLRERS